MEELQADRCQIVRNSGAPPSTTASDGFHPQVVVQGTPDRITNTRQNYKSSGLRNDNTISRQSKLHFQIFIVMAFFPRKTAFLDAFPLCPQGPSLKITNVIFIVVSPSLRKPDRITNTQLSQVATEQSFEQMSVAFMCKIKTKKDQFALRKFFALPRTRVTKLSKGDAELNDTNCRRCRGFISESCLSNPKPPQQRSARPFGHSCLVMHGFKCFRGTTITNALDLPNIASEKICARRS